MSLKRRFYNKGRKNGQGLGLSPGHCRIFPFIFTCHASLEPDAKQALSVRLPDANYSADGFRRGERFPDASCSAGDSPCGARSHEMY